MHFMMYVGCSESNERLRSESKEPKNALYDVRRLFGK